MNCLLVPVPMKCSFLTGETLSLIQKHGRWGGGENGKLVPAIPPATSNYTRDKVSLSCQHKPSLPAGAHAQGLTILPRRVSVRRPQ